jgi:hypothetical protein
MGAPMSSQKVMTSITPVLSDGTDAMGAGAEA